jgi:hypothetical protein
MSASGSARLGKAATQSALRFYRRVNEPPPIHSSVLRPMAWLKQATTMSGSWWDLWQTWSSERSGSKRPAPAVLGRLQTARSGARQATCSSLERVGKSQGYHGHCHVGDFYRQSRDALIGRRQGNQWLGKFHGGTGPLQNPLFLANVTMPLAPYRAARMGA